MKMKKDKKQECDCNSECNCGCGKMKCCGGSAVYGLGFIGACVYYIANATGFWMGVLGVLKAIVWPAMLVFKLLGA
jgi:hypothetical protein